MDRRPLLLVALVVLMLPSFEATAQQSAFDDEFNLGWEHNFGDVYITTAPLFHDDAMFVRTSASSSSGGCLILAALAADKLLARASSARFGFSRL